MKIATFVRTDDGHLALKMVESSSKSEPVAKEVIVRDVVIETKELEPVSIPESAELIAEPKTYEIKLKKRGRPVKE